MSDKVSSIALLIQRILCVFFLAGLCLSGCHRSEPWVPAKNRLFHLPFHVAGASDKRIVSTQRALLNRSGVQVLSIGEDNLISLKSSLLFPDQSPRLLWRSHKLLTCVANYMRLFRQVSVTITAYVVPYRSPMREAALTLARARVVGNYLISRGIDARLIVTEGASADKPIYNEIPRLDRSPDSRVEIVFREAVV